MNAYRKEVWSTIISCILLVLAGNMGLFFVWFPNTQISFLGFPITYIIPVIMGWLGLLVVTMITAYIGNQLDDEIEAATGMSTPTSAAKPSAKA